MKVPGSSVPFRPGELRETRSAKSRPSSQTIVPELLRGLKLTRATETDKGDFGSVKLILPQMLLDPLEEQFHLPTHLVELANS
jgi:hypothetical protein